MERLEYTIIPIGKMKDRLAVINKLGSEGWEMIQIYSGHIYFKRVKRSM